MNELERVAKQISERLGIAFSYYAENARPRTGVVCDRQFEGVIDDGSNTFFRFLFKSVGYIGVLSGAGDVERNYAALLPSYIESFMEKEAELSKTEHLKRILQGECSSMGIYKYATKYSVRGAACFTVVLRVPKLIDEILALLEQYGGNSLDTALQMNAQTCVLVRFVESDGEDTYRASVDYAEFLAQSIKEELGLDVAAGVGSTVRELKDVALSYAQAENTLRYADVFDFPGNVHSYRECVLIKMIEDVPETKLVEYFSQITDERFKEVFEDEEMLDTAEAFLQSSLNVSETSRNLYMHRNTLLYRLDKIEKATGLNIRLFSDAVSFRVLTVLHKLLKK
ncbi:MAG: helix-turn-helix domain-containing protein [Clostridia bacterium]|nr:helix-turn-helix domain-containing protein [Clostridia bacterium]